MAILATAWPNRVGRYLAGRGHGHGLETSLCAVFPSSLTSSHPSWTAPTSDIPTFSRPSLRPSQDCPPRSHTQVPLDPCRVLFSPRLQTHSR